MITKKNLIFIAGIVLSIFIFMPEVEAKEYVVNDWFDGIDLYSKIDYGVLEPGDKLIYDYNRSGDYSFGTQMMMDTLYLDLFVYDTTNNMVEHYQGNESNPSIEYTIKSYEELTSESVPVGQKAIINAYVETFTIGGFGFVNLYYTLVDDEQKQVEYYNTYDAVNNNPKSYYVGQEDILLSGISRDGYEFLGWYTSPTFEEGTEVTMITGDEPQVLKLYAKWRKVENNENVFTNPETSTSIYIILGIVLISLLGTAVFVAYKKIEKM